MLPPGRKSLAQTYVIPSRIIAFSSPPLLHLILLSLSLTQQRNVIKIERGGAFLGFDHCLRPLIESSDSLSVIRSQTAMQLQEIRGGDGQIERSVSKKESDRDRQGPAEPNGATRCKGKHAEKHIEQETPGRGDLFWEKVAFICCWYLCCWCLDSVRSSTDKWQDLQHGQIVRLYCICYLTARIYMMSQNGRNHVSKQQRI